MASGSSPERPDTHRSDLAAQRRGRRHGARGHRRPTSTAPWRRPQGVRQGDWPRMTPEPSASTVVAEVQRGLRRPAGATWPRPSPRRWARPSRSRQLGQVLAAWMVLDYVHRGCAAEYPFEERRAPACSDRVIVRREPVGVVGAIVPWNVPQFVTMSKLAPRCSPGCTIVIKPVAGDAARRVPLAELLEEAGIPKGVVNIVPGRPRGRRAPRASPRRRQDRVHRVDRRRAQDRLHLR